MKIFNSRNIIYISILLMVLPILFVTGVVMEQFFQNNSLLENIFIPLHNSSGLLSSLLIVGLPSTALLLNILPFNDKYPDMSEKIVIRNSDPASIKFNILVSISVFLVFTTALSYVIFENIL